MKVSYRAIYSIFMDEHSPIPILDAPACLFPLLEEAIKVNKDLVDNMLTDKPRMGGKIIREDRSNSDCYWCNIIEVDENDNPLCIHGYCYIVQVISDDNDSHLYRGYTITHKDNFYHIKNSSGFNCTVKSEFLEALLFIDFHELIKTTNSLLVARNKLVNGGDNNE